jgi:predicted anti-sigma-YlaC factor YlaD
MRTSASGAGRRWWIFVAVAASLTLLAGCSLRRLAVDTIGDALAAGGSVYESDADVTLVGDALPFSVKLMDSLVAESPRHRGLLLAASRAYLLYAYGYVGFRAEQLTREDVDRAGSARARAHLLSLRAFDYAMRGIELGHPGFGARLARDPAEAVRAITDAGELDLLYAAMASLGLAIGSAKQDPAMLARLPEVEALLARGLALDEAWNAGALHDFAVSWYTARPGPQDRGAIERHYARALELSRGTRAGLFVAYAEGVSVREQNRRQFQDLLDRALAVDLDRRPDERLQNSLAQRRAVWLRGQADFLFLE